MADCLPVSRLREWHDTCEFHTCRRDVASAMKRTTVRAARTVAGFGLLGAGVAMLALPGPGWLTIAAGLAVLASEFPWARRLLDRLKATASRIRPWAKK
jgi:uncharacterized protein (TIGR02611 family)